MPVDSDTKETAPDSSSTWTDATFACLRESQVRHRRDVFPLLRNSSNNTHHDSTALCVSSQFLPEYGLTLGEFVTGHVLFHHRTNKHG